MFGRDYVKRQAMQDVHTEPVDGEQERNRQTCGTQAFIGAQDVTQAGFLQEILDNGSTAEEYASSGAIV